MLAIGPVKKSDVFLNCEVIKYVENPHIKEAGMHTNITKKKSNL